MSQTQTQDAAALLAEILGNAENPTDVLKNALDQAAQSNGVSATQQLQLLVASDPNMANYMRPHLPASVKEHQRYLPTEEVYFKDGSFGESPVSINKADFDAKLHIRVDDLDDIADTDTPDVDDNDADNGDDGKPEGNEQKKPARQRKTTAQK